MLDRNLIKQRATKVSKGKIPLNLYKLIESLGGKVKIEDIPYRSTAALLKDGDSFTIILDKSQIEFKDRTRFSLAHEIGHLILHMDYLGDYSGEHFGNSFDYHRPGTGYLELEANCFAADILMPEELFREICAKYFDESDKSYLLKPIAEYFDVPLLTIRSRGRELGLFSYE